MFRWLIKLFSRDEIKRSAIIRDIAIIFLSLGAAMVLIKTYAVSDLLISFQETKMLGSFVAGIFFVSFFTAAPAAVILVNLMLTNSIIEVAFFAGLGAVLGDFVFFRFFRDSLGDYVIPLANRLMRSDKIAKSKILKWILPFVGAIIIASPFPDEVGLMLMGLSKMRVQHFIILSFLLNFTGILVIGAIARELI